MYTLEGMIKRFYWLPLLICLITHSTYGQIITNSDIPIAPLQPTTYQGWTNAFKLRNAVLELVVVPDVGRIVYMALNGGVNFFRLDEGLMGQVPAEMGGDSWMNFGGDWFWPVSQARWTEIAGKDWPPPPVLAERPWCGSAWKGADGSQYCLINREYGAPLHIKASRLIKLECDKPVVTIRQKIESIGNSSIPVTLWNISQVARPDQVVLPVDAQSIFSQGYKVLNFDQPGTNVLVSCGKSIVLNAATPGEYKLGSDAEQGWVAAVGKGYMVERAANKPCEAPYPDGGCRVECYVNSGLGYAEIETLSPERMLQAGECLENTLTIQLAPLDKPTDECSTVVRIQKLLGEE